jgi:hypothetical protein
MHAHPPWRHSGSGIAYARFKLALPKAHAIRFVSEVAMDAGAVGEGRTDGVTYTVLARADGVEKRAELHNATANRAELALDLTEVAGKDIQLELQVHPGPRRSPSFDWARWYGARIERDISTAGELIVAGETDWSLAVSGREARSVRGDDGRVSIPASFPGAVFLLRTPPPAIETPFGIAQAAFATTFVDRSGKLLDAPRHACARPETSTVDGVARPGLFTHPPDYGATIVDVPLTLPDRPVEFHAWVGVRDGSESDGVVFIVQANGVELARHEVLPGGWHEIACDLAAWQGTPVVLTLLADSDGPYICDWAHWGEPTLLSH